MQPEQAEVKRWLLKARHDVTADRQVGRVLPDITRIVGQSPTYMLE